MKILVAFLDYLRHDYSKQSLRSIANAGYQFDMVTIDKKGIASAINDAIDLCHLREYDALVTCANDIEMPDDWLKHMVDHAQSIPNTGMCGMHCVESIEKITEINGKSVHPTFTAFGNVLIPMKAIRMIGYFNEDYDPYGMQDGDYAYRLNKAGFINYYIPRMNQNHLGNDVGNGTEYRKMKDDGLALADEKWKKWCNYYDSTGDLMFEDRHFRKKFFG